VESTPQPLLDQIVRTLRDAARRSGRRDVSSTFLDVGCGTGATTLARSPGRSRPKTVAVGVDISAPMIAAARARAPTVSTCTSPSSAPTLQRAPVRSRQVSDMLISRFGVMFFDDPVRAFANLHRAVRSGADLRCIAWRSAAENPFMTDRPSARRSACLAGPTRAEDPTRPGSSPSRTPPRSRDPETERLVANRPPAAGYHVLVSRRELVSYLTRLGPVGLALQDADDATTRACHRDDSVPPSIRSSTADGYASSLPAG
jgi:SAM-dependent methyltransferase